jgi:Protein of unknown function (DUF4446)
MSEGAASAPPAPDRWIPAVSSSTKTFRSAAKRPYTEGMARRGIERHGPVRPEPLTLALVAAAAAAAVALIIVLAGARPKSSGDAVVSEDAAPHAAAVQQRLDALERRVANIGSPLPAAITVGFVRYNPFPEMGGNISFSVALLDTRSNGVVISVLNDRQGSRVYGKPVEAGASAQKLSDEEQQAIGLARGSGG